MNMIITDPALWLTLIFLAFPYAGGSAAKFLCNGLPELQTDWSKWYIFFCDERHVPFDDPECTYAIYKRDLMSKVPIKKDQIFPDNPDVTGILVCSCYLKLVIRLVTSDST